MADGNGVGALDGLKVLDLMWVIAGPSATRALADYGATVVRVESTKRVETGRTVAPFHNGEPGPENSGLFGNMNANKLGLTLDLTSDAGRDVARDLVRWADIVCEAFSPRAMRAWGMGYEALRAIKPEIIMLSSCLFGQDGPHSQIAGFGTMGSAISGFVNLGGYPDRAPVGPFGAYTDYLAPRFTIPALLAALDYRDRTGEGVYIDQAQAESAMHFMTTALLDYTVNGHTTERAGNRDPQQAPHDVYAGAGDDEWVAITVASDEVWDRFCAAIGQPGLADDARFTTLADRKRNEEALDAIVTAWTAERPAAESERTLQASGVAAHVLQTSSAAFADPQFQERGHFVVLDHPVHGQTTVEGSRYRFSRTPAQYVAAAPTFGRDNEHVLKQILGYDDATITELVIAGVLE